MLITCPECGHQVSDQAKTCPSCGIEIAGKITRCPDCGEVIFKEQSFCPNCHCSINGASVPQNVAFPPAQPAVVKAQPQQEPEQAPPAPRRPRRHRAGLTAIIVAFVLALIVVFLGIYFMKNQERQNEQRAYTNAMLSSEPLVLQNFLDMYVDAPLAHRDSIKVHLEALKKIDSDWADALVNNSRNAYERYMKLHPSSRYIKEAMIKIDSLDWIAATKLNTVEAFKKYITDHEDGIYVDEARANFERLEAQKLTDDDRQMVVSLFNSYFNAIAQMDEAALSATLAPVLTSFLHRANATKEDVCQYMQKMHEADITGMSFTQAGDWDIEKREVGEGRYSFTVKFTTTQRIERTDENRETSVNYRVTAQVSPEGRITEFNMKRSVQ